MQVKLFVIDCNNSAFKNSKIAEVNRILVLKSAIEEIGPCLAIVSHELRYRINDRSQLELLLSDQVLLETPRGTDNDLYLLETTQKVDGNVVSNDHFREYRELYPNVIAQRLPFMIVENANGEPKAILPWKRQFMN